MSKYTWRDLIKINSATDAYSSPLACLAHIDMNAFFAQVEQIRCGYSKDEPVVCVQWSSIIAVSYAARKFNISRMDTIESAMEKCPSLVPIHTAVFKKGENFWQYHDGFGSWSKDPKKQLSPEFYKVSLDPYRRESRKILKIFKEFCDVVEKASVDEVFLDLGRICFQRLMELDSSEREPAVMNFNELKDLFVRGKYDLDSKLPSIPEELKSLKFHGFVFQEENASLTDWDDVIFWLASKYVLEIRTCIQDTLGYSTSCGVARTKMLCKLGSNFKKPDAQVIILNKNINAFLDCGKFDITSFWTLGGLLGKQLVDILNLPSNRSINYIRENWQTPQELTTFITAEIKHTNFIPEHNKSDFERVDILAQKLYDISRGQFVTPLNPKPVVKTMMSNKNMRGKACSSLIDCISWLEVFCGELDSRVKELEREYNKVIMPKTVTVSLRTDKYVSFRKSGPLVHRSRSLNSEDLLKTGIKLITELNTKYNNKQACPNYYPLKNLNLSISNFEIMDIQKTIIDMFGNQTQLSKPDADSPKDSDKKIDDAYSKENAFYCDICEINSASLKEFNEHKDFHIATKLSESLNGTAEDSANLSLGEQRLLFPKKRRDKSNAKSQIKKPASKGNNNIFKYFSK
ncbi:DNA-directed DNA polymerase eta KNAG_0C04390 [Huiozyma naganishii CBS 8797]|uniref:DNA polymerase eta n=1 Tax=Huiozyma naganishii (strain ATCC MYA-139 / BCRC 22969 / CBS 8797 / KCTC 17520 / NBRC 10181 / NCYC 3082 / Yp74L-3) TaxID=1071383 RepID=J7S655_HUIN7|nr:hypothetical protein KNAG_0C04390 [Kazachstania naganishii CBS 8797]CCK69541.1 hypothetical protein KNAG_0C04390 [Kazachstania naganishii CBS 8797]